MKIQFSSRPVRRVIGLLATGFAVVAQTSQAQENVHTVVVAQGGEGIVGFATGAVGSGPHVLFFAGGADINALLMKSCDINQDGGVTPDELKGALVTWFREADTDTNGGLNQLELSTGLKEVFPEPVLPPEVPRPPGEFAPHNILAKGIVATIDSNKDGWVVFEEVVTHIGENLPRWDMDANGWLAANEIAFAFGQFMRAGKPEQGNQFFERRVEYGAGAGGVVGARAGTIRIR